MSQPTDIELGRQWRFDLRRDEVSGEELQKAEVDKFTATPYEDNPSEQKAAMLASVKHCIT